MKKTDIIGYFNKNTGEILNEEVAISVIEEGRKLALKELFHKVDNCPNELSIGQIYTLCGIMKVDLKYLDNLTEYHMVNDYAMGNLFDLKISMKAYYYFGFLTSKYCSSTYTLLFDNNRHIEKDIDISNLMGISKTSWSDIKKELEELKLIKKVYFNKKTYYKVNPIYIRKGKTITESTWYAFREEIIKSGKFPEIKRIYWDKIIEEEYGINTQSVSTDTICKAPSLDKSTSNS